MQKENLFFFISKCQASKLISLGSFFREKRRNSKDSTSGYNFLTKLKEP